MTGLSALLERPRRHPGQGEGSLPMPELAVVTPMFNAAATIGETVSSVFAQSTSDWAWWILDDGSSDDSVDRARRAVAGDCRVRIVEMGRVGHIGALRNFALTRTDARAVCFLDADDSWRPRFLESQSELMLRSKSVVVHCGASHLTREGEIDPSPKYTGPPVVDPPDLLTVLLEANPIYSPSVMVDRAVLLREGGFSEHPDHFSNLDFDLWLRMAEKYRFAYNPERLLRYRLSPEGLSLNPANRLRNARGTIRSLEAARGRFEVGQPQLAERLARRLGRSYAALGRALLGEANPDLPACRRAFKSAREYGFGDFRSRCFEVALAFGGVAATALWRWLEWRNLRRQS